MSDMWSVLGIWAPSGLEWLVLAAVFGVVVVVPVVTLVVIILLLRKSRQSAAAGNPSEE